MRERAAAMRSRVLARVAREPCSRRDLDCINASLSAALEHRDARLADDHDIDLLHPARTLLIMLDDIGAIDPAILAIAAGIESVRPELAAYPRVFHECDVTSAGLAIPTPLSCHAELLLEALLSIEPALQDAALAERLDHARHLHLRPRQLWNDALLVEEAVYLPLASRRPGRLAARYHRWHRAFSARIRALD